MPLLLPKSWASCRPCKQARKQAWARKCKHKMARLCAALAHTARAKTPSIEFCMSLHTCSYCAAQMHEPAVHMNTNQGPGTPAWKE